LVEGYNARKRISALEHRLIIQEQALAAMQLEGKTEEKVASKGILVDF
jgi:hypothetical protein